jgi:hypothetical protein
MWVIYDHPSDYPNAWVVREWKIADEPVAMPNVIIAKSLKAARAAIPPGLFCMPRWQGDDPAVVEVWL